MRPCSTLLLLALLGCPPWALAQDSDAANRKAALAILSDAQALAQKPVPVGANGWDSSRFAILNHIFQERLAWNDLAGAEALAPILHEKHHRPQAMRALALAYEKEGRKDDVRRIRDALADELKALRATTKHELTDAIWHELAKDCARAGDDEGFRRFAIDGRNPAYEPGAWQAAGQELAMAGQEEAALRCFKRGWAAQAATQNASPQFAATLTMSLIREDRQALIPLVMKEAPPPVRFTSYLTLAAHQNDWEDAKAANVSFAGALDELAAMCLAQKPDPALLESAKLVRRHVQLSAAYDDELKSRTAALTKKFDALGDSEVAARGLVVCAYLNYGSDPSTLLDWAMERAKDIKDAKGNGQAKTMVLHAKRELGYIVREEASGSQRAAMDQTRAAERERRKQLGGKLPPKPAQGGPRESAEAFIQDAKAGRWEEIGRQLELEKLSEGYSSQGVEPAVRQLYKAGEVKLAVKLLEVAEKAMPGDHWMNAWMALIERPPAENDSELVNRVFAKLRMWMFIDADRKALEELQALARAGEYDKARAVKAKINGAHADAIIAAELAVAQALRGDDELARQSAKIALASSEREIQGRGVRALAIIGLKQLNKGNREGMVAWSEQYKTRKTNDYHYHHAEAQLLLNRLTLVDLKAGNAQKAVETQELFDKNANGQERQRALFRVVLHCVQSKDKAGAEKSLKSLGDPLAVKPWTVERKLDQFGLPVQRDPLPTLKLHQLLSLALAYQKVADEAAGKHVLEFVVYQAAQLDAYMELERLSEAYARRATVDASRLWIDQLPDLLRARGLLGVAKSLRPGSDVPLSNQVNVDISELYFN